MAVANFETLKARTAHLVDNILEAALAVPDGPEKRLIEAMRYTLFGGGKKFRPFLCMAAGVLFDADETRLARIGAAIEAAHCYSLIHDDLPAMDDDDMRRGRASLHCAYDEATALLAGNGLLSLAFEILAADATHSDMAIRLKLISELATAAGVNGMIGGQMIDILAPQLDLDAGNLSRLQRMKTGALISYAVRAGAWAGGAEAAQEQALAAYAHDIGLAFQIADDLLDYSQDETNFVSLMGVERARAQADMLIEQAIQHLHIFGEAAAPLIQAAQFVVERNS